MKIIKEKNDLEKRLKNRIYNGPNNIDNKDNKDNKFIIII